MVQFIPSIEKIMQFKVQPEPGGLALLRFPESTLDDSYEVYFNPFLNGDRPDVVIMRKGGSMLFIEVNEWNLVFDDIEKTVYIKSPTYRTC